MIKITKLAVLTIVRQVCTARTNKPKAIVASRYVLRSVFVKAASFEIIKPSTI